MSRTSASIQMLLLLKARGCMSRDSLAKELHCKTRNISEYRKELESVGYQIDSTTGKYGGYTLNGSTLLPVNRFTPEEVHSLQEARHYLLSHNDFLQPEAFTSAMDKLLASLNQNDEMSGVYMNNKETILSKSLQQAIRDCEWAKREQRCVRIKYRSLHAHTYKEQILHPYEILHYQGSYYCLGYSLKAKEYRTFKFSEERMLECKLIDQSFHRDPTFHLKDHIGKSGLVKEEVFELELYIYGESARRVNERVIGIDPTMYWVEENILYLKTIMEGKIDTIHFLLSLKNECKLLSNEPLRKEMSKIIEDMKQVYSNSK